MVYYLSEDEIRRAERLARRTEVDEEFRGWRHEEGPMAPPYDAKIPLFVVASQASFSSKEEYEEYIRAGRERPSREMVLGLLLHKALASLVSEARTFIYSKGEGPGTTLYSYLMEVRKRRLEELVATLEGEGRRLGEELRPYLHRFWLYEALQVSAAVDRALAQGLAGPDAISQKALPFIIEYEVDGSLIGLSERLKLDALGQFMVVFELKTGKRSEYHKLATTGYALALESQFEHPVNVGCLVYLGFRTEGETPLIRREVHAIDEPLRRWFVEERDKKLEVLVYG